MKPQTFLKTNQLADLSANAAKSTAPECSSVRSIAVSTVQAKAKNLHQNGTLFIKRTS